MGLCCSQSSFSSIELVDNSPSYKPKPVPLTPVPKSISNVHLTFPSSSFLCTVCLDENNKTPIEATICGHVFHTSCLRRWWKEKFTCPYCSFSMQQQKDNFTETIVEQ